MSTLAVIVGSIAAVLLALFLAFVPLRLMLNFMARRVAQFIQRRKERRVAKRESPDRRVA